MYYCIIVCIVYTSRHGFGICLGRLVLSGRYADGLACLKEQEGVLQNKPIDTVAFLQATTAPSVRLAMLVFFCISLLTGLSNDLRWRLQFHSPTHPPGFQ